MGLHAYEVQACEVHAYEVQACEVHAREIHAYEMYARENIRLSPAILTSRVTSGQRPLKFRG